MRIAPFVLAAAFLLAGCSGSGSNPNAPSSRAAPSDATLPSSATSATPATSGSSGPSSGGNATAPAPVPMQETSITGKITLQGACAPTAGCRGPAADGLLQAIPTGATRLVLRATWTDATTGTDTLRGCIVSGDRTDNPTLVEVACGTSTSPFELDLNVTSATPWGGDFAKGAFTVVAASNVAYDADVTWTLVVKAPA